jgi:signal transduction histidine kinase
MGAPHSLGLLGMRERAAVLAGRLTICRVNPNGTRVTVRIPSSAERPADRPEGL